VLASDGYYYYYYFRPRYRHGEWLHLLIGAALVLAVGLSWLVFSVGASPMGLALDAALFVLAFLLHEMAHKFSAMRYGYFAEFRLQTWGAILTAVSVVIPFFKIVAPGATVIYGPDDPQLMGRTAMWGPATNISMAAALMAASHAVPPLGPYLSMAAYINSFIAFFNLIPLGILDGLKVLRWSKGIWAAAFAASVALLAISIGAVP
jgi:Zn-dependent protease